MGRELLNGVPAVFVAISGERGLRGLSAYLAYATTEFTAAYTLSSWAHRVLRFVLCLIGRPKEKIVKHA
jgi:hypothetical protein